MRVGSRGLDQIGPPHRALGHMSDGYVARRSPWRPTAKGLATMARLRAMGVTYEERSDFQKRLRQAQSKPNKRKITLPVIQFAEPDWE